MVFGLNPVIVRVELNLFSCFAYNKGASYHELAQKYLIPGVLLLSTRYLVCLNHITGSNPIRHLVPGIILGLKLILFTSSQPPPPVKFPRYRTNYSIPGILLSTGYLVYFEVPIYVNHADLRRITHAYYCLFLFDARGGGHR